MKASSSVSQLTLELENDLAVAMAARRHSARIGQHQARELIERVTQVFVERRGDQRFSASTLVLMDEPFIH